MAIPCMDEASFNTQVRNAQNRLVVVDFFATWCGPCKAIAPEFESLAKKFARNCVFLQVDVDKNPSVAQKYNVKSMPTFIFLHRNTVVETLVGGNGLRGTIENLVDQYSKNVFEGKGKTLGGASSSGSSGKRVNPWADPNFKPSQVVVPSSTSTSSQDNTSDATEVVCDGDICTVQPVKSKKINDDTTETSSKIASKPATKPASKPASKPTTTNKKSTQDLYNMGSTSGTQTVAYDRDENNTHDELDHNENEDANHKQSPFQGHGYSLVDNEESHTSTNIPEKEQTNKSHEATTSTGNIHVNNDNNTLEGKSGTEQELPSNSVKSIFEERKQRFKQQGPAANVHNKVEDKDTHHSGSSGSSPQACSIQ